MLVPPAWTCGMATPASAEAAAIWPDGFINSRRGRPPFLALLTYGLLPWRGQRAPDGGRRPVTVGFRGGWPPVPTAAGAGRLCVPQVEGGCVPQTLHLDGPGPRAQGPFREKPRQAARGRRTDPGQVATRGRRVRARAMPFSV